MKAVKDGILINMRALNSMQISQDGTYATLGGGVTVKEVQGHLWAHSKQTVTGCCECVGLTAVVLGGGHGLLQGYHGLLVCNGVVTQGSVEADGDHSAAGNSRNLLVRCVQICLAPPVQGSMWQWDGMPNAPQVQVD